MSAHPRKILKEAAQHLSVHGIYVAEEVKCKRHRKLVVTNGQKKAMIVISLSPASHRVYHHIVQSARQALREAP